MEFSKKPYHSSLAWQKADDFVLLVYRVTVTFPDYEKYNCTSQLRRAALSIPLNIVEGMARSTTKEYLRFLYIARGSCMECSYLLEVSYKLRYLDETTYKQAESLRREVSYFLQRSMSSLQGPKE